MAALRYIAKRSCDGDCKVVIDWVNVLIVNKTRRLIDWLELEQLTSMIVKVMLVK